VSDSGYGDFEFERRFVARDVPRALLDESAPTLIVQSYVLASDGYALRIRVQSGTAKAELGPRTGALDVLEAHAEEFDFCTLTAKGPMIGGTRYEAERELDVSVGVEMVRRGGLRIVKNRHSVWLGADGWVIDVFGGADHPLVIAECERSGPVTDLQIPTFCVTEVTDDHRFANDALVHEPFGGWQSMFDAELSDRGPRFLQGFGHNSVLPEGH
jgi:CYTH domain-containing protein